MSEENVVGNDGGKVERAEGEPSRTRVDIEVRREICTEQATLGRLFINGAFECYTLEDRVRPKGAKIAGATAIPTGCYELTITESQRFGRLMPQLLNVPMFEGIRIHPGNTDADTRGCILVGASADENCLRGSRVAFRKLFEKLRPAKQAGAEVRVIVSQTGAAPPDHVLPGVSAQAAL